MIGQVVRNLQIGDTSISTGSITQNIIPSGKIATKIGIQAPYGTTFWLNNKPFVMGKTEIFQVDNWNITSVYFNSNELKNIIVDFQY